MVFNVTDPSTVFEHVELICDLVAPVVDPHRLESNMRDTIGNDPYTVVYMALVYAEDANLELPEWVYVFAAELYSTLSDEDERHSIDELLAAHEAKKKTKSESLIP